MCRRLTAAAAEEAAEDGKEVKEAASAASRDALGYFCLLLFCCYIFQRDFHWLDTCLCPPAPPPFLLPCGHLGFLWKYFETFVGFGFVCDLWQQKQQNVLRKMNVKFLFRAPKVHCADVQQPAAGSSSNNCWQLNQQQLQKNKTMQQRT